MYSTWVGKNVDLSSLISAIEDFFEKRGFSVKENSETAKHYIVAKLGNTSKTVDVLVEGDPNNFGVESLFVSTKSPRETVPSMLGGGPFLLSEIRWRESLLEMEKEFFAYLDIAVTGLINSAGKSNK